MYSERLNESNVCVQEMRTAVMCNALHLGWFVLLMIKQNLPNLNCSLSMSRIDAGAHLWKISISKLSISLFE